MSRLQLLPVQIKLDTYFWTNNNLMNLNFAATDINQMDFNFPTCRWHISSGGATLQQEVSTDTLSREKYTL